MNKPARSLAIPLLGLLVGYVVLSFALLGEGKLLEQFVTPHEGMDLQTWLNEFQRAQNIWVQWPAMGGGMLWIVITVFHPGIKGDLRGLWLCLWGICVAVAFFAGFMRMPETASSLFLPLAATVVNGVAAYYMDTAASSISTHKFAPFGSLALRRTW